MAQVDQSVLELMNRALTRANKKNAELQGNVNLLESQVEMLQEMIKRQEEELEKYKIKEVEGWAPKQVGNSPQENNPLEEENILCPVCHMSCCEC